MADTVLQVGSADRSRATERVEAAPLLQATTSGGAALSPLGSTSLPISRSTTLPADFFSSALGSLEAVVRHYVRQHSEHQRAVGGEHAEPLPAAPSVEYARVDSLGRVATGGSLSEEGGLHLTSSINRSISLPADQQPPVARRHSGSGSSGHHAHHEHPRFPWLLHGITHAHAHAHGHAHGQPTVVQGSGVVEVEEEELEELLEGSEEGIWSGEEESAAAEGGAQRGQAAGGPRTDGTPAWVGSPGPASPTSSSPGVVGHGYGHKYATSESPLSRGSKKHLHSHMFASPPRTPGLESCSGAARAPGAGAGAAQQRKRRRVAACVGACAAVVVLVMAAVVGTVVGISGRCRVGFRTAGVDVAVQLCRLPFLGPVGIAAAIWCWCTLVSGVVLERSASTSKPAGEPPAFTAGALTTISIQPTPITPPPCSRSSTSHAAPQNPQASEAVAAAAAVLHPL